MIALTARLNERDDAILGLQEELDAYEKQQKTLEDEVLFPEISLNFPNR